MPKLPRKETLIGTGVLASAEELPTPVESDPRGWRRWLWLGLIVGAVGLRAAFFAISVTHLPASSDECISVLMAKHISQGERPLLFWGQPYQFPLEAYALSPLVRWMPRTAFGARYLFFAFGLLSVAGFLLILRRMGPFERTWPAALLLLFPSTYWLTLQVAYFIPHYTAVATFSWLLLWMAARADDARPRVALAAIAGVCAGLGFSTHMLILSVAACAGVAICVGRRWQDALCRTPAFVAGLAAGLAPFLLATAANPKADDALHATRKVADALGCLWNPSLSFTLPGALGVTPPLFPDFNPPLEFARRAAAPVGAVFAALLAIVTVLCIVRFVCRTVRDRWPSLKLCDVFVGIAWLTVAMFAMSRRGRATEYRYMVPAVFAFPFLVACLYRDCARWPRRFVGAAAIAFAAFNLFVSGALMREWVRPGFAAGAPRMPDLSEPIRFLKERGATRAYASLWTAYRITYDTDEAVICSQPCNERFPSWPMPYQETVNEAEDAPYILRGEPRSRFGIDKFVAQLKAMDISAETTKVGPYVAFYSFTHPTALLERPLQPARLNASASDHPEQARLLIDGDPATAWRSGVTQTTNMWVEVRWPGPVWIGGVTVHYNSFRYDHIQAFNVWGENESGSIVLTNNVRAVFDPLRMVDGRPICIDTHQTIRFAPVRLHALRIGIAEITPGRRWSIAELEPLERIDLEKPSAPRDD